MNQIIFNATCLGNNPDGIGVYCREIIDKTISEGKIGRFLIFITSDGLRSLSHISYNSHVAVKLVPRYFSAEYGFIGHLLRLLFSQYLALKYPKTIIFNPSQLEVCFNHKYQVVMVHDLIPMIFNNDPLMNYQKKFFFFRYILGAALRNAGAIITPSKHTLGLIKKEFHPDSKKLFVVPNGIKFAHSKFTKTRKDFILFLGSLRVIKNVHGLISAYRKIADQVPHKLVIAGGGNIDWLEKVDPSGPGTVEYTGFISDEEVDRLLSTAALFVFPSFYEGFGFPPLEAMVRGCPVVVSNVASLPEICGEAALYVNPRSVDSIADAMVKVISDESLRKSLIQYGYERANQFTWEKSAKKHLKVFDFVQTGMK